MSVSIYKNKRWHSLFKQRVYSNGKYHLLDSTSKIYINGKWRNIVNPSDEITFYSDDMEFNANADWNQIPVSANLIYVCPDDDDFNIHDGTSFSKAYRFSEFLGMIGNSAPNDVYCFLYGIYETSFPIVIPNGVRIYGGFNGIEDFSQREPFVECVTLFKRKETEEENPFPLFKAISYLSSYQVIGGICAMGYSDLIEGCVNGIAIDENMVQTGNVVFCDSMIDGMTSGNVQCIVKNCRFSNSKIMLFGSATGSKMFIGGNDFHFEGIIDDTLVQSSRGNVISVNNTSQITDCIISGAQQVECNIIRNNLFERCGIVASVNSFGNKFWRCSVSIINSSYDSFVFGADKHTMNIQSASDCEFFDRRNAVVQNGINGQTDAMIINGGDMSTTSMPYSNAQGSSEIGYGDNGNSYLVIDGFLYSSDTMDKIDDNEGWGLLTGFSNVKQTTVSDNGLIIEDMSFAYGTLGGIVFSIENCIDSHRVRALSRNGIEGVIEEEYGTWSSLCGKSSVHLEYRRGKDGNISSFRKLSVSCAYGICNGRLYCLCGSQHMWAEFEGLSTPYGIVQDGEIDGLNVPFGITQIGGAGWTAISGFSTFEYDFSAFKAKKTSCAYGICNGRLYELNIGNATEVISNGNIALENTSSVSGFSFDDDDKKVYAQAVCGGRLYIVCNGTAYVNDNSSNWESVYGFVSDDYGCHGYAKENKIINESSIKSIYRIGISVKELVFEGDGEVYGVDWGTFGGYGDSGIFILSNGKVYCLEGSGALKYLGGYNGNGISILSRNSLIFNENISNIGNLVKNASRCKFYNDKNIFVKNSNSCLFVNCISELYKTMIYGDSNKIINLMLDEGIDDNYFGFSNGSYIVINGKLFYGSELQLCDDSEEEWTASSGLFRERNYLLDETIDDRRYGIGIRNGRLFILEGEKISPVNANAFIVSGMIGKKNEETIQETRRGNDIINLLNIDLELKGYDFVYINDTYGIMKSIAGNSYVSIKFVHEETEEEIPSNIPSNIPNKIEITHHFNEAYYVGYSDYYHTFVCFRGEDADNLNSFSTFSLGDSVIEINKIKNNLYKKCFLSGENVKNAKFCCIDDNNNVYLVINSYGSYNIIQANKIGVIISESEDVYKKYDTLDGNVYYVKNATIPSNIIKHGILDGFSPSNEIGIYSDGSSISSIYLIDMDNATVNQIGSVSGNLFQLDNIIYMHSGNIVYEITQNGWDEKENIKTYNCSQKSIYVTESNNSVESKSNILLCNESGLYYFTPSTNNVFTIATAIDDNDVTHLFSYGNTIYGMTDNGICRYNSDMSAKYSICISYLSFDDLYSYSGIYYFVANNIPCKFLSSSEKIEEIVNSEDNQGYVTYRKNDISLELSNSGYYDNYNNNVYYYNYGTVKYIHYMKNGEYSSYYSQIGLAMLSVSDVKDFYSSVYLKSYDGNLYYVDDGEHLHRIGIGSINIGDGGESNIFDIQIDTNSKYTYSGYHVFTNRYGTVYFSNEYAIQVLRVENDNRRQIIYFSDIAFYRGNFDSIKCYNKRYTFCYSGTSVTMMSTDSMGGGNSMKSLYGYSLGNMRRVARFSNISSVYDYANTHIGKDINDMPLVGEVQYIFHQSGGMEVDVPSIVFLNIDSSGKVTDDTVSFITNSSPSGIVFSSVSVYYEVQEYKAIKIGTDSEGNDIITKQWVKIDEIHLPDLGIGGLKDFSENTYLYCDSSGTYFYNTIRDGEMSDMKSCGFSWYYPFYIENEMNITNSYSEGSLFTDSNGNMTSSFIMIGNERKHFFGYDQYYTYDDMTGRCGIPLYLQKTSFALEYVNGKVILAYDDVGGSGCGRVFVQDDGYGFDEVCNGCKSDLRKIDALSNEYSTPLVVKEKNGNLVTYHEIKVSSRKVYDMAQTKYVQGYGFENIKSIFLHDGRMYSVKNYDSYATICYISSYGYYEILSSFPIMRKEYTVFRDNNCYFVCYGENSSSYSKNKVSLLVLSGQSIKLLDCTKVYSGNISSIYKYGNFISIESGNDFYRIDGEDAIQIVPLRDISGNAKIYLHNGQLYQWRNSGNTASLESIVSLDKGNLFSDFGYSPMDSYYDRNGDKQIIVKEYGNGGNYGLLFEYVDLITIDDNGLSQNIGYNVKDMSNSYGIMSIPILETRKVPDEDLNNFVMFEQNTEHVKSIEYEQRIAGESQTILVKYFKEIDGYYSDGYDIYYINKDSSGKVKEIDEGRIIRLCGYSSIKYHDINDVMTITVFKYALAFQEHNVYALFGNSRSIKFPDTVTNVTQVEWIEEMNGVSVAIDNGKLIKINPASRSISTIDSNDWTSITHCGYKVFGTKEGGVFRITVTASGGYVTELTGQYGEEIDEYFVKVVCCSTVCIAIGEHHSYEIIDDEIVFNPDLYDLNENDVIKRFGTDKIIISRRFPNSLSLNSNFSTFANCYGNVEEANNTIYWNSKGRIIRGLRNAQSEYHDENHVTLGYNNAVAKFNDIGYTTPYLQFEGNNDECPKQGAEEYAEWTGYFGDFHFDEHSVLNNENNYGKRSNENQYDLDNVRRVNPNIGAYEYFSSSSSEEQENS